MAGDWIKIEHWTPDKPEIFKMADNLGIDPDAVVGKLVRIWIWADQQTIDGNAASVTLSLLDRLSSVTGFGNAMIQSGWLSSSENGLKFVNFDRHNGETAKTRALTAKRVNRHRNSNASVTEEKRDCNASVTEPALPREEKRREEIILDNNNNNKRKPRLPKTGDPYSEIFLEFWKVFPASRRQKKPEAFRAWQKVMQSGADPVEIIQGASDYASSYLATKDQGKYCMGPEPFLNGHRWEDDRESWKKPKKPSRVPTLEELENYDPYADPDTL